jgi:hypothetical protein
MVAQPWRVVIQARSVVAVNWSLAPLLEAHHQCGSRVDKTVLSE